MSTEPKKRKPPVKRFVRNPDAPDLSESELRPTHVQMLRDLHEHRLLRTSHLVELNGGSERNTRKIRRLFDSKYVRRIPGESEAGHGSNPDILHALDARGATYLKNRGEFAKRYRGGGTFNQVEHTLLAADFIVAVRIAAGKSDSNYHYLPWNKILEHKERLTAALPFLLKAQVPSKSGGLVNGSTNPDGLFGLENVETGNCRYFFVEADRGTMVLDRKSDRSKDQSSVKEKYQVYLSFRQTKGLAAQEFGFKNGLFGVLLLTPDTLSRPETLVGKLKDVYTHPDGSQPGVGNWFFAHTDTILHPEANVLTAPWLTGTGAQARLTPAEVTKRDLAAVN